MKKIAALATALVMLLGSVPCLAEEAPAALNLTDKITLEMELPDGYDALLERMDTALYATIATAGENKTNYVFSIAYADLSDGPTPGEMTQEDIDLAMKMISSDFYNPSFTVETTGGGTKFLVINENDAEGDYALMIANYEGYFVQMYITPAEGLEVTEADVTTALEILTSMVVKTE